MILYVRKASAETVPRQWRIAAASFTVHPHIRKGFAALVVRHFCTPVGRIRRPALVLLTDAVDGPLGFQTDILLSPHEWIVWHHHEIGLIDFQAKLSRFGRARDTIHDDRFCDTATAVPANNNNTRFYRFTADHPCLFPIIYPSILINTSFFNVSTTNHTTRHVRNARVSQH